MEMAELRFLKFAGDSKGQSGSNIAIEGDIAIEVNKVCREGKYQMLNNASQISQISLQNVNEKHCWLRCQR